MLVASGRAGRLRLLAGMIRANRPWRLVPTSSGAFAAASAASAVGVFYSSVWRMATDIGPGRLMLITAFAVAAVVAWLIASNGSWGEGDAVYYVLLMGAVFMASIAAIPPTYLAEEHSRSYARRLPETVMAVGVIGYRGRCRRFLGRRQH